MKYIKSLILVISISVFFSGKIFAIEVVKATCEMMVNPVGLNTDALRFGWMLHSDKNGDYQTAYQVIVSSSLQNAEKGQGDIWDSGMVKSQKSQFVPYEGKGLESGKKYFWRVKVWDAKGKVSCFSEVSNWYTAPSGSYLSANWIGAITREDSRLPEGRDFHAPLLKRKDNIDLWENVNELAKKSIMLRKPVSLEKEIENATIYISGLGHYELTINGRKVGDSEFAPLWSDYDKTVYYNTYEVQDLLLSGENVIGVLLGNGMYNVTGNRYKKLWVSFGPPTLFFKMRLQYKDGSVEDIVSDATWKFSESPITFNCIYGGEDYDANLEQEGWGQPGFDDGRWKEVVVQESPKGKLRPQLTPAVKKIKEYDIKEVSEPLPGVHVLDMGQNLSGYPAIKVKGKKGQKVRLLVGESLKKDGTVAQGRSGGPHYYEYTLKGEGVETWKPRFSYYGFQYIQVEGVNFEASSQTNENPVLLEVRSHFIYSSVAETASFECSNEIFNKAHWLINNAVKSNMHSVFTDCPHREKLGWLEEVHLNGPGLMLNYDLTQFIPKVMQDIADGQRERGLVPSIVPEYVVFGGDFSDSPEWGSAAVIVPWMYYEYYGDPSLLHQYYDVMKRYVDYLSSTADNYIVSHGLGDWYDYGDHAAGYAKNSPIALSATSHYYFSTDLLAKAAKLTGNEQDHLIYSALTKEIKDAFNAEFFDPLTRQYATGSQFSNAVPVFLEIVEEEHRKAVLKNLVDDIRKRGNRLTTGDVGNRYLYQALALNGHNDVMFDMHNHYDAPGYGFQINFGLTTLTEQWDPRKGNSWNHFMMGQIDEWFFHTLAGINPDKEQPGFKHFFIQPEPVGDLTYVKAAHQSLYGEIIADWKREGNNFIMRVKVPVNTSATIVLPGIIGTDQLRVNKTHIKKVKNIDLLESVNGKLRLKAGSGNYIFEYPVY